MMKLVLLASSFVLLAQMSQGRVTGGRPQYDTFADAYSSMGDIDWGKRSGYDNWINPAYGYASMADTDWGWKKRADESSEEEEDSEPAEDDGELDKRSSKVLHSYYTPYKYRQPYALASSSYMPHKSQAEPQSSINAAAAADSGVNQISRDIRSRNGNKLYNYASMADMDWGWKRKRSDIDLFKRNLASLARGNELPSRFRYRRVDHSNDVDPMAYWAHQYNLVNQNNDNNDADIQIQTRSGIGSLARNGGIRAASHGRS